MRYCFSFLLLVIIIISACKKVDNSISDTPEIGFVSLSPSSLKANADSLSIIISYKDGNGDLGENDNNVKNLFVTDNRNNVTYQFRIKQLAPNNATIAIQGELDVVLNSIPLVNGTAPEQATYSIYIKDRSGNQSNTITTGGVTVNP
jgi:hypothetical protein